ncbi:MAG: hypothetical protein IT195_12675 [Microthrixaceae bacterium]|nr:hypothetical protein [Microthrixaceae bacterium]
MKVVAADLPGAPYDLEFFFDSGCPFGWLTSRWIRRVAELLDLRIGWRIISLHLIHENDEVDEYPLAGRARARCHQVHRVMVAVRRAHGNEAVGRLYEAWGPRLWDGEPGSETAEVAEGIELGLLLDSVGLPAELASAEVDASFDAVIAAETALAFERAGEDVGTPVITFDPARGGGSFFGPVISSLPDDDNALAIYEAVRVLVDLPTFSELKRTNRPPLDLPRLRPSVL